MNWRKDCPKYFGSDLTISYQILVGHTTVPPEKLQKNGKSNGQGIIAGTDLYPNHMKSVSKCLKIQ